MKKSFFISLCFAAVLGLTACVEQQQINPTFNPVSKTVNTNFVLSIAAAGGDPLTKQAGTEVQTDGVFLGMDNATLFVFQEEQDGKKLLEPKEGVSFDLSTVLEPEVITSTNSHRILELPLPLGANTMIFYGMATKGEKADEVAGLTNYIYPDGNIKHIGSFAEARLPENSDLAISFNQTRGYILAVLNGMIRIGLGGTNPLDNTPISEPDYAAKTVHWQDYLSAIADNPHSPLDNSLNPGALEIILGKTYDAFTNISDSEARSGSGGDISSEVAGLLFLCNDAESATVTNPLEEVAKQFFSVLDTYIKTFFNVNGSWKGVNAISDGLIHYGIDPVVNKPEGVDFNSFPANFKLPVGVAVLKTTYSQSGQRRFEFNDSPSGTAAATSTIYDVTYPPQLCYYCNSPLYISNSTELDPDGNKSYKGFPNSPVNWSDPTKWTSDGASGKWETDAQGKVKYGHITTTTRGVAMAFNVQYGQAILDTRVTFKEPAVGGVFEMYDNNSGIPGHSGQSDQIIKVDPNSAPLVLTGIIIGGQPSVANWQYLPWSTIATDLSGVTVPGGIPEFNMNKMVYDSFINPQNYPSTGAKLGSVIPMANSNYTVVHDNYNFNENEGQKDVFVALQILNATGQDFWGKDNMVRAGGTFYLLLNLPAPDTWPAGILLETDEQNMMPPYDNDGKTIKAPRVFMADTRTQLVVTLSKDALKEARVTIPDLRTAKISFGLSVDLTWKTGAAYNLPL